MRGGRRRTQKEEETERTTPSNSIIERNSGQFLKGEGLWKAEEDVRSNEGRSSCTHMSEFFDRSKRPPHPSPRQSRQLTQRERRFYTHRSAWGGRQIEVERSRSRKSAGERGEGQSG